MATLRTIQYIANIRLPTEKAHGMQIMKSCEAFARAVSDFELIVPNRKNPIQEDPFAYYSISNPFTVKKLFTIDTVNWGRIGFILHSIVFGIRAALHVRKNNADVVYGRDEITLAAIGFLTNKKIFWESHDGAWNIWAKYLGRRAQGIIVVTRGAADFYAQQGIAPSRLFAVSNGIDLNEFAYPEPQETARKRLGLPLEKKIVLYIGRVDGWKGVPTLLEASREISEDICIAIIGGEEHQIKDLREQYSNVFFLGFRPYKELKDNQAAADVLVLPNTARDEISIRFTSPLKMFSYMSTGKPIIASDLQSLREVLDEQSAVFFEPDNARSLVSAIAHVFNNQELAAKVGDTARQRVARYTWDERAKSIRTFIEKHL